MVRNELKRPDTLLVKLNDRLVGTLTRLIDETIIFAFDPSYEADSQRPVLSLSFKAPGGELYVARSRTSTWLSPFFSNLLPEGHLREYLARKLDINTQREFYLLAGLGADLPGAVIVEPMGELIQVQPKEPVSAIDHNSPLLRFSLAGVQLKFSAILESKGGFTVPADGAGGSWIVKLPSESHMQVPETEYSMLSFAAKIGITVPEFKLVPTTSVQGLPAEFQTSVADSLAVKRFDRTDGGGRVHMEDFAQVFNVEAKNKYEKAGYAHIARVLWMEDGENSFSEFVRRLVFTIAIGNGDMHLKNWSLLYSDPLRPVLSPAYDFVPTIAYISNDTLALNLGGTKDFSDVSIDRFKKMASQAKASERLAATIATETIERIQETWSKEKFDLKLPNETRQAIDKHMETLVLFRPSRQLAGIDLGPSNSEWLKNLTIVGVEYDPLVPEQTMCLEAMTGNTTAVTAPERMEHELMVLAARRGVHPELADGPVKVYVGEKLYKEWRKIQFITIDNEPRISHWRAMGEWDGEIQDFAGSYNSNVWQRIVSAYERKSIEAFDLLLRDGSIRTFNAKVEKLKDIERSADGESTSATVQLRVHDVKDILKPNEGIAYLLSDFDLPLLQDAVERVIKEEQWETSLFSEPKKVVARRSKAINFKGESLEILLEVEISFLVDVRKTDLLIKMVDVDGYRTSLMNREARLLRQSILDHLPVDEFD